MLGKAPPGRGPSVRSGSGERRTRGPQDSSTVSMPVKCLLACSESLHLPPRSYPVLRTPTGEGRPRRSLLRHCPPGRGLKLVPPAPVGAPTPSSFEPVTGRRVSVQEARDTGGVWTTGRRTWTPRRGLGGTRARPEQEVRHVEPHRSPPEPCPRHQPPWARVGTKRYFL